MTAGYNERDIEAGLKAAAFNFPTSDPLADKARADWAELVAEVGECEPKPSGWCARHDHATDQVDQLCHVGRALFDMSDTLSMLLLERQP